MKNSKLMKRKALSIILHFALCILHYFVNCMNTTAITNTTKI